MAYVITFLPTGEEVTKPCNDHGLIMTIKQARKYLKSDKSYTVRHLPTNEIYFTREDEFREDRPCYNKEFCAYAGRVKIDKTLIRISRIKK